MQNITQNPIKSNKFLSFLSSYIIVPMPNAVSSKVFNFGKDNHVPNSSEEERHGQK